MAVVTVKFSIAIIIISHGLISVDARNLIDESSRTLSRQARETGDEIKLSGFIEGKSIHWGSCNNKVEGGIMNSFSYSGAVYSDQKCEGDSWRINWDEEDLGESKKEKSCLSVPSTAIHHGCSSCNCAIYHEGDPVVDDDIPSVTRFNADEQSTDISENKVIRGIVFSDGLKGEIGIAIDFATLLSDCTLHRDRRHEKLVRTLGKPFVQFKWDTRTVFLDDIVLPIGYVVTGVRFAHNGERSGLRGVQLEVGGSKYDSSCKLESSIEWFDHNNNHNTDESYNRSRTEIPLTNFDASPKAPKDIPIDNTNRYVRVRAAHFQADETFPAIPYFSKEPARTTGNLPLRGLGISYKGYDGYGGYFTVKIIPHELPMFIPAKRTTALTTETTIETTTEMITESTIELTTETTIETTTEMITESTIKPKIISAIKLRTTSTTEPTTLLLSNIPTPPPPTIQPKPKRLRTHPVNVSCSAKSEMEYSQQESANIFGDLLIPIDREGNCDTIFLNKFFLISTLLLFVLL